jgi:hypothetical protein
MGVPGPQDVDDLRFQQSSSSLHDGILQPFTVRNDEAPGSVVPSLHRYFAYFFGFSGSYASTRE